VAGTISRLVYMPYEYEVELKLDRRGRVKAVIERWFEGGRIREKKRRIRRFPL